MFLAYLESIPLKLDNYKSYIAIILSKEPSCKNLKKSYQKLAQVNTSV